MQLHSTSEVLLDMSDGVSVITLNSPDRGNALSASMVERLHECLDEALADDGAHCLVFRGEGRHLCTGFDLSDLEQETDGSLLHRFVRIEQLLQRIWTCPISTEVVGQGKVFGAGADLFAACDLRLASDSTTFAFPGSGFGIILGTRRLAARIGRDAAREILTGGLTISAQRAIACGLASRLCDLAEPQPLRRPPVPDPSTVRMLREATGDGLADTDLAMLVRSAASPGLKSRIAQYRSRQIANRH